MFPHTRTGISMFTSVAYVMAPGRALLSPVTSDNEYVRDRLYIGRWDFHGEPAWTPDGKSLLLLSNRNVPLGSGHIWRTPAEAKGILRPRPY